MNKRITEPCSKMRGLIFALRTKINNLEFNYEDNSERLLKDCASILVQMDEQKKIIERLLKKE